MLVEQQKFRSDLFYRFNVIAVSIPPLHERKQDILPLAMHFLDVFAEKYNYVKTLSPQAEEKLLAYSWPGNVRELRNVIERAVIMSPPQEWELTELPIEPHSGTDAVHAIQSTTVHSEATSLGAYSGQTLKEFLSTCERHLFTSLLSRSYSPSQIARLLDINLSSVYRKLRQHKLTTRQSFE